MMKFVALCCLAAVCSAYSLGANGPSMNLQGASCDYEGKFSADEANMCWYHECVMDYGYGLSWMPRRCAWMSRVSSSYTEGFHNPCTVRISLEEKLLGNPCERREAANTAPPSCAYDTVCYNGGTAVYEGDICWCVCPDTWQGDSDCSKPTMIPYNLPPMSNICVHGQPMENWCEIYGGCLNGGTCYNQCDTFWCDCGEVSALSVDHIGKRCEIDAAGKKSGVY